MKNTLLLGIILTLALAPSLVACDSPKSKDGPAQYAGIIFQEDQFFRLVDFGMKAGAKTAGAAYLSESSSNLLDREASLIDTYVAQGVQAIIISPISMKSSLPALQRAADKGVTIITYNTAVEGDVAASFIESNQSNLGMSTGKEVRKYIEEKLGGKAKIAMLECIAGAPEQCTMRSNGFLDAIKDLPDVEVVARQDGRLANEAANVASSLLTAHPDLDIIWAANEGGTEGAVTAVRNSPSRDRVKVFGTDMSEQLANFLLAEDGILLAVTGQRPFEMGRRAAETASKALAGEPVDKVVILDGELFTRENAGRVQAYKDELATLIGG